MANLIRRVEASTFLQAIAIYCVFVVLSLFSRAGCELYAMLGLTIFSIFAPLQVTSHPHFWRELGVVILCWFGLAVLIEPTCEALLGHKIGEEAMVLLLPFMLFPLFLLIAVPIYLFRRPKVPVAAKGNEPEHEKRSNQK
jgi:hypothetical protein